MADGSRGQQLIVGCLAASTAVAAGSAFTTGDAPGIRMLVGVSVTGASLAVINMFSPDLAGGFAVLILTTTLLVYGEPFVQLVSGLTAPVPTPTAGTSTGGTTEGTVNV